MVFLVIRIQPINFRTKAKPEQKRKQKGTKIVFNNLSNEIFLCFADETERPNKKKDWNGMKQTKKIYVAKKKNEFDNSNKIFKRRLVQQDPLWRKNHFLIYLYVSMMAAPFVVGVDCCIIFQCNGWIFVSMYWKGDAGEWMKIHSVWL